MRTKAWVEDRRKRGSFSIRWYDPVTGKAQRLKVNGTEERDRELNRIEKMLLDWKPTEAQAGAIPLVILERYLTAIQHMGRRSTTIEMKRKHLTSFCDLIFRMEQLNRNYIEKWIEAAHKRYKIDTICIRLRDIRAFVRWCHKEGILPTNVFDGIRIPNSSFVGRRLTVDELKAFLTELDGNVKDFVLLALETGTRRGELLQLEFSDIDFDRRFWLLPGREGKSKSKRDRVIPLSQLAVDILLNRKRRGLGRVFEGYTKDMLAHDFKFAKQRAGIAGRLRPHDLRHTWASNFRGRASSLKAIAGWSTDQMMSHYTHVELEELREDMAKGQLGEKLGEASRNLESL